MADRMEKEAGGAAQDRARTWAEKRLILLEEAEGYENSLSGLTGSGYEGDFDRLKKLDHYGQAKMLEMMVPQTERRKDINGLLGAWEVYGLLFAGPSGCGKMTTAEHLVGNLKGMGYRHLVSLTGARFGNHSRKKAVKRLKAILNLASQEQPLILILERLSENTYAGELYDILLEFAEAWEPGVFFPVLIEEDAGVFSAALKRDFPLISFSLPSLEERKTYIRVHQVTEVVYEEEDEQEVFSYKIGFDGITPEEIAEETEGFSFDQMRQLMEYVKLYLSDIVARDQVSEQYAYERLLEGGYYKVKGHMVRQAIAFLKHGRGNASSGRQPESVFVQPEQFSQVPQERQGSAGQPSEQIFSRDNQISLSELEQKVKLAAEGGPKDTQALAFRYQTQVYRTDEFGDVDERLAGASDDYDKEE